MVFNNIPFNNFTKEEKVKYNIFDPCSVRCGSYAIDRDNEMVLEYDYKGGHCTSDFKGVSLYLADKREIRFTKESKDLFSVGVIVVGEYLRFIPASNDIEYKISSISFNENLNENESKEILLKLFTIDSNGSEFKINGLYRSQFLNTDLSSH